MAKRKKLPKFEATGNAKSFRMREEVQIRLLDHVTTTGATATEIVNAAVMQFGGDLNAVTHAATETNAVDDLKKRISRARKFASEVDAVSEMEWPKESLDLKDKSLSEVKQLLALKNGEVVTQALIIIKTLESHHLFGLKKTELTNAKKALRLLSEHYRKSPGTCPPDKLKERQDLVAAIDSAIKAVDFLIRMSGDENEPK